MLQKLKLIWQNKAIKYYTNAIKINDKENNYYSNRAITYY